jgi:hypothetical protein
MPTRGGEGVRAPTMQWRDGLGRRQEPIAAARVGARVRWKKRGVRGADGWGRLAQYRRAVK